MATLTEIARQHTSLERPAIAHLQRLIGEWGMLADFCFGDLLLFVPAAHADDGSRFVVLAQVRPVTAQTLYPSDWVGEVVTEAERPMLGVAWRTGSLAEGEVVLESSVERAQVVAIPVRQGDKLLAVLTREWSPTKGRQPGELERTYLDIFVRLARMIMAGTFPFANENTSASVGPRVGDGVMVFDASARVEYASPNAVSALHRVGINANVIGLRLAELGFDDGPLREAFESQSPVNEEIEQIGEVTLVARCIPLVADGKVTGGVMLLRDVSELRRRDRLLMSKDATIREIHHRVKNNLQTISSLLRLQGRRLRSAEAKDAVEESVRRIRTIALVHETLSHEAGDDVAFMEIVRPLARMAEESLQSPDRPVRFRVVGDGGKLPAHVATPLAVVLTELLQNAVDHAFAETTLPRPGSVAIVLQNDGSYLSIIVVDDGRGLPDDFVLDKATGLGLSIVRTLVTTELAGTIDMRRATAGDFGQAHIVPDEFSRAGTAVELRVPVAVDR
ncbi:MAG: sensor histidine kinase [Acidimicrobiia bacterium]